MASATAQLAEGGELNSHETEQVVASLGGMKRFAEMRQLWALNADSKVRAYAVALCGACLCAGRQNLDKIFSSSWFGPVSREGGAAR